MSIKKIIKTKILCLVFFIPVFSYSAWQGSGTETDPFLITSRQCLEALRDSVNNSIVPRPHNWSSGKYFKVMNDITDPVTTVIGVHGWMAYNRVFDGVLDGNGKTISLAINNSPPVQFAGLFAINTGVIKNLTVDGFVICNLCTGTGAIAGRNGELESVNGIRVNSANRRAQIINVTNNSNVTGRIRAGGIAGEMVDWADAIDCINSGEISLGGINFSNSGFAIGGIVGGMGWTEPRILGSINTGTIRGVATSESVGGIVGYLGLSNIVSNSANYGFVEGNTNVGGIVGMSWQNMPGGFVSNNFNGGVVVGNTNVGCIIGFQHPDLILENNHYDKQMCGEED